MDHTDIHPFALELKHICKSFASSIANNDVSMSVPTGTVHAVVGENGAGKSTLVKIVYGVLGADKGEIFVFGQKAELKSPKDGIRLGIGMVSQHFMLVERFSVLENIILGQERHLFVKRDLKQAKREINKICKQYNLKINLNAIVADLSVAEKQTLEILKVVYQKSQILILDEPTAVLTPEEIDRLFDVIRSLKASGVTVIIITHKLNEVKNISDNLTVMYHGKVIKTIPTKDITTGEIAELMVGKKVSFELQKRQVEIGDTVLKISGVSARNYHNADILKGINLHVKAGEIVSIAGVAGGGQSDLLRILFGMQDMTQGVIEIGDLQQTSKSRISSRTLRRHGVACIPEDRLVEGLIRSFTSLDDSYMGYHYSSKYRKRFALDRKKIMEFFQEKVRTFDVNPKKPDMAIRYFSGGNQQKLVFARETWKTPKLLLIGQPTRGVDIRSVNFIHNYILDLRSKGVGILIISSEMDEILNLSDRIYVMCHGAIIGELDGKTADEATLGRMMGGEK